MNKLLSTFAIALMALMTLALASCSKDNDKDAIPAGCGTVQFELTRQNVYIISALTEARTIKVTLTDADGNDLVLPSLELTGNEDHISTKPYPVKAGTWTVKAYKCFDLQGDLIEDLDIELTRNNELIIISGENTPINLPIQVKQVLTLSNLYNVLYGLCMEVLGPDKSKWPPSWNFDGEGVDQTWAGLEFEWDVATDSPAELIGIVIDGDEDYIINSDTWEQQLVSLPEFKHMKKLPACLAQLTTLDGITIRNCDMEEIDEEFSKSPITSLSITNTKLKHIPESFREMNKLCDVWLEGNDLQEFPEALTECKSLYAFVLKDEPSVTSIPESIANWSEHLITLTISGTGISSLPDVFDKLWRVSTLNLENNPALSTLPPTIGLVEVPYAGGGFTNTGITGLILDGCGFTAIPDVAKRPRMQMLSMRSCKLTSVTKADFDPMTDLQSLYLDYNKFTSFPALTNPKLGFLSLNGCGLTKDQIDISGLPSLNPANLYCY